MPSSPLFFFNDTATTEIYTLSLHDALPISSARRSFGKLVTSQPPRRFKQAIRVPDRRGHRQGRCTCQRGRGQGGQIGRAHVSTSVTGKSPMPSSACKKKRLSYCS